MADPDFNSEERFIIAYYESGRSNDWAVWLIHAAMVGLFAYGLYHDDHGLIFAAFGVVVLWRVYERSHQPRFFRATRSVFQKYAQRVKELSARG